MPAPRAPLDVVGVGIGRLTRPGGWLRRHVVPARIQEGVGVASQYLLNLHPVYATSR
jgi:hypothetical protein